MARVKISAAVLVLVMLTGVLSHLWIRHECGELIKQTRTAMEYLNEDDFRAAEARIDDIAGDWSRLRNKAGIFVRENKLLETDRVCARLKNMKDNDSGETAAELSELRELLENIY